MPGQTSRAFGFRTNFPGVCSPSLDTLSKWPVRKHTAIYYGTGTPQTSRAISVILLCRSTTVCSFHASYEGRSATALSIFVLVPIFGRLAIARVNKSCDSG